MAVSSSNGGLGSLAGDLVMAAVGRSIGTTAGEDSSSDSCGDRGGEGFATTGSETWCFVVPSSGFDSDGLGAAVSEAGADRI